MSLKNFLSPKGRYNRTKYWGNAIGSALVISLLIVLILNLAVMGIINGWITTALTIILYFLLIYISFLISIKRLHDLDKTGWMSLLGFIPLANIYLFVICGFFKGTDGSNQYGEDPLKAKVNEEDQLQAKINEEDSLKTKVNS